MARKRKIETKKEKNNNSATVRAAGNTSGGDNNCLLHSIIPHLIDKEILAGDDEFRELFANWYQLDGMDQANFQDLFQRQFTARHDRETILGPVLRVFLHDCMQNLRGDGDLTVEQIRQAYNADQASFDINKYPASVRGFVHSWRAGELSNDVTTYSHYLQKMINQKAYLDGKDLDILQERWGFYWRSISYDKRDKNQVISAIRNEIIPPLERLIITANEEYKGMAEELNAGVQVLLSGETPPDMTQSQLHNRIVQRLDALRDNYDDPNEGRNEQPKTDRIKQSLDQYIDALQATTNQAFRLSRKAKTDQAINDNARAEAGDKPMIISHYVNHNHFEFIPEGQETAIDYDARHGGSKLIDQSNNRIAYGNYQSVQPIVQSQVQKLYDQYAFGNNDDESGDDLEHADDDPYITQLQNIESELEGLQESYRNALEAAFSQLNWQDDAPENGRQAFSHQHRYRQSLQQADSPELDSDETDDEDYQPVNQSSYYDSGEVAQINEQVNPTLAEQFEKLKQVNDQRSTATVQKDPYKQQFKDAFFSQNRIEAGGNSKQIRLYSQQDNDQEVPYQKDNQDNTQIQSDYMFALAEQMREISLDEIEEEQKQNKGPK